MQYSTLACQISLYYERQQEKDRETASERATITVFSFFFGGVGGLFPATLCMFIETCKHVWLGLSQVFSQMFSFVLTDKQEVCVFP